MMLMYLNKLSISWVVLLASLFLPACQQSNPIAQPTPVATPSAIPATPTLPAEQAAAYSAWSGSPHSNTYDLEKGPNTFCARCHAPANWDYQAKADPPPNCVSCKFPHEDKPRIAVSNPLVPEEEWKDIGCEVCHRMNGKIASPEMAWLDNATGYYETITDPDVLCEKCHITAGAIQRGISVGEHAHKDYRCVQCHEPHSTTASCVSSGCHEDVLAASLLPSVEHANLIENAQCEECHPNGMQLHDMETQRSGNTDCLNCHIEMDNVAPDQTAPAYHSKRHAAVDCVACHDASGMEVMQAENSAVLTTFRTIKSPSGVSTAAFVSHDIQTAVDCQRCHYAGNSFNLPEVVNP